MWLWPFCTSWLKYSYGNDFSVLNASVAESRFTRTFSLLVSTESKSYPHLFYALQNMEGVKGMSSSESHCPPLKFGIVRVYIVDGFGSRAMNLKACMKDSPVLSGL
ncbi:hypothetical protein CEXT_209171 [Caerostris extrusa]|uniref:Uncharacterized protein n=1 Tax=Caerostris extrusa TaxID=172846 RepID=A0AAV4UI47_CAEEX|nr:hypothetical protein CEXT_209171 [Caerostris extrusa]